MRPKEGDTEYDNAIEPMKPFSPVTIIEELPVLSTLMVKLDGFAPSEKSVKWNRIDAVPL